MEEGQRSLRALVACALVLTGCQVRGLVGSNESADSGPSAESVSGGADSSPSDGGSVGVSASGGTGGDGASGGTTSRDSEDSGDASSSGHEDARFDVSPGDTSMACAPPKFPPCDGGAEHKLEWQHVLGLCDEDAKASYHEATLPKSVALIKGRVGGPHSPYSPREGQRMLVLSTGDASELSMTTDEIRAKHPLECEDPLGCPSTDLGGARRNKLPDPMTWRPVHTSRDCSDDPGLIGEGDCSNSLAEPWQSGDGAYDYGELRMVAEVPRFTDALAFHFAFFSSEYPLYTEGEDAAPFNDMFVAWLESEAWTGNVSFDDALQPITAQSVFMDYRSPSEDCPDCAAPELDGFAMEHHAGTKWLTTKAPVVPGETIELVFSIFDLSDSSFDSMVLLDGFEWSCSSSRPITTEG